MEKILLRKSIRWRVHRIEKKREKTVNANDSEAEDIHASDNDTENDSE